MARGRGEDLEVWRVECQVKNESKFEPGRTNIWRDGGDNQQWKDGKKERMARIIHGGMNAVKEHDADKEEKSKCAYV